MTVGEAVRIIESLDMMCKRCVNYEICQGSGCEPKKVLNTFITETVLEKEV